MFICERCPRSLPLLEGQSTGHTFLGLHLASSELHLGAGFPKSPAQASRTCTEVRRPGSQIIDPSTYLPRPSRSYCS